MVIPPLFEKEPYCASLLDCLNRGVNVRILLNPRTDGENVPFLRDYLEQITGTTGNLKMRSYPDVAKNMTQTINDTAHFTLVDDNMYRIEYDIQEFKATASFNSEEVVKRLQTAFDMVWSMNPQHN